MTPKAALSPCRPASGSADVTVGLRGCRTMTVASSSNVDWNKVTPMTMAVFLKRFTLHDSWVKEVFAGTSGHVTLAIGFDLHWNDTVPQGYDTLLLHFDRTYSQRCVQGGWTQPTISGA